MRCKTVENGGEESHLPFFVDPRARSCRHFFVAEKEQLLGNTDATAATAGSSNNNNNKNNKNQQQQHEEEWNQYYCEEDYFDENDPNYFASMNPQLLFAKRRADINALDVVVEVEQQERGQQIDNNNSTTHHSKIECIDVRVPLDSLRLVFPQLVLDFLLESTMLLPVVDYPVKGKK